MKKLLFVIATFCCLAANAADNELVIVKFSVEIVNKGGVGNSNPKSPINPPQATLDDHVLTFTSGHADYTLTLLDENGDEAYVVAVPSSTSIVVLPATLTGTFEVQLDFGGSYIFVSEIEL